MSLLKNLQIPLMNNINLDDVNALRNQSLKYIEVIKQIKSYEKNCENEGEKYFKENDFINGKYYMALSHRCREEINYFQSYLYQLIFRSYNIDNNNPSLINITGLSNEFAMKKLTKRIELLKYTGSLKIIYENDNENINMNIMKYIVDTLKSLDYNASFDKNDIIVILPQSEPPSPKELSEEIKIETLDIPPVNETLKEEYREKAAEKRNELIKEAKDIEKEVEKIEKEVDELYSQSETLKDKNDNDNINIVDNSSDNISDIHNRIDELKKNISRLNHNKADLIFKSNNIFIDNSVLDLRELRLNDCVRFIKEGAKKLEFQCNVTLVVDEEFKQKVIEFLNSNHYSFKQDQPFPDCITIVFDLYDLKRAELYSVQTPISPPRRRASTAVPEHAHNPAFKEKSQCCIMM